MSKRVIIVGGVAGGMSCAARIKRLDESAEVVVFEKGGAVSFANCGMPYYVGGVISDRASMIVQTAETLKGRYDLDIRTHHEVTRILPEEKTVEVRNLENGKITQEPYDVLLLATGAAPVRPPIPGLDSEKVCALNNLDDMDKMRARAVSAKSAVVIGAGFIGLEVAENLRHLGVQVTLVEMLDQVLPVLDKEMTAPLAQELRVNGVDLRLTASVTAVNDTGVALSDGSQVQADLVCLCTGVAPRSELAREAGLELGPRGHIVVDAQMRTSVPEIFAVGDAVQTTDRMTGAPATVPLAGPANRQARIAADVICGRDAAYPGVLGTSIVQVFNQKAASTGASEKRLKNAGTPYFRIFVHPMQHAKYYPGAAPVSIKGMFSPDGVLLGAQVVGTENVDTAIDVLATALTNNMTASDMEHLELSYSPQFNSAKSGINMLGFAANNLVKGDMEQMEADDAADDIFWLDVRAPEETECGVVPGATVIPLDELRNRLDELPRDKKIGVYCAVGLRGYIAYRQLKQQGFNAANLDGGYRTWTWFHGTGAKSPVCGDGPCDTSKCTSDSPPAVTVSGDTTQLDVRGLQCPGPIVRVKQAMAGMSAGAVLEVTATDVGFIADIPAWCASTGNSLLESRPEGATYVARIAKGSAPVAQPTTASVASPRSNNKTIVCFSDDLDRVMATFVIANGAAAMNSHVTIFFTFWGLNVLKKKSAPPVQKGLLDKMFGMMMPKGPGQLKLSKMHMGGMGTAMMRHVMRTKNVMSPEELVAAAREAGVKLVACSMSMDVMGIKKEELIDGIEIGGVGAYLGEAEQAGVNLFI